MNVLLYRLKGGLINLDGRHAAGPTTDRFETQCATAGERVENPEAMKVAKRIK
jgi:hypothetical protein